MSTNVEDAPAPIANRARARQGRIIGSRVQRTLLAVIGLLNMVIGGFGILYIQSGHDGILLLDVPNDCDCKLTNLRVHSYVESTFQILLGAGLICLLMTKRSSRYFLGTCWVWFGLFGLILSIANFIYSLFTHGCNPINPFYFAVWFTIHITELLCVGYYARSQSKPKKRRVTLADLFQHLDIVQQMPENSNEKVVGSSPPPDISLLV